MNTFSASFRLVMMAGFFLLTIGLPAQGAASAAPAPLPPQASAEFIILDYHTFIGNPDSNIDFTEAEFSAQLDRMLAMGYQFVRLEDAMAGKISGRNNIALTIDDGNHSVYPMIKHVLGPRHIPAFLFIYAGVIDARKFAMSAAQVQELAELGYGIGAHGWFHEYMTRRAWKTNPAKVMLEVTRSGPGLQKITGTKPSYFAYPFGVGAADVAKELQKVGYEWLFSADAPIVPISLTAPGFDRTDIPRTLVFRNHLAAMMKTLEKRLHPPP